MKWLKWTDQLSWPLVLIGTLTLGMAPFFPEPHFFEKIGMLVDGTLSRPIDIFDLFLHGFFPIIFVLKGLNKLAAGTPQIPR